MAKVSVKAVPQKGFRRIGIPFTQEPRVIEVDAKQLAILKAEKNLVVTDAAAEDDKKKGK